MEAGRILASRRTRQIRGRSHQHPPDRSSRFRESAGFITATNARPRKAEDLTACWAAVPSVDPLHVHRWSIVTNFIEGDLTAMKPAHRRLSRLPRREAATEFWRTTMVDQCSRV